MSPPWMPLYIADYRADTAHLSAAEHGAYLNLIMHYWTTGGLPDDDRQLARIACMTPAEWRRARPTIKAFFQNGWRHKRIDSELERTNSIVEKRRDAAKEMHRKRRASAHANAGANAHARHVYPHKGREETYQEEAPDQKLNTQHGEVSAGGGLTVLRGGAA